MRSTQKVTYEKLVKAVSGAEYRTLQSIGDEFGLTRERIRQLINKHDLRTAPARQIPDRRKNCRYCGEIVDTILTKQGKRNLDSHASCSQKYHDNIWATIPCNHCNTDIRIRKLDARLKRRKMEYLFCSYRCAATYRINHGTDRFGVWAKSNAAERKVEK